MRPIFGASIQALMLAIAADIDSAQPTAAHEAATAIPSNELFSPTSQVPTILASLVDKLAAGTYRQQDDPCDRTIEPTTKGERHVRELGWGIVAEQPIDKLLLVSFAGEFIGGTSGSCAIRQGNVGIFEGSQLRAVLNTAKKSEELIGQLQSKEDDEVRLWSGKYLRQPLPTSLLTASRPSRQFRQAKPFCSGKTSVPNVYGLPITEARKQLQAAG